ncbi:MAG: hypothetical protein V1660_00640 [archaeon]
MGLEKILPAEGKITEEEENISARYDRIRKEGMEMLYSGKSDEFLTYLPMAYGLFLMK